MPPIWLDAQTAPPLSARLYSRIPIQPVWIGVILSLLYMFGVIAYFSLLEVEHGLMPPDAPPVGVRFWEIPGWWTLVVNAAMIGFGPTVLVNTLRSVERDVRDLSPALSETREGVDELILEVARLNPRTLRVVGLATALVMLAITFLDPGLWQNRGRPSLTDPMLLWFVAQQMLLGWLWSRAIVADVATTRAFASLARRIPRVDLFDLQPLGVFARRGVRSVLYWMLGLAFFSLFWLGPNAGRYNAVPFVLLIALAGWNLTKLLRSSAGRIREEKADRLSRLRAAIRAYERALLQGDADADPDASKGETAPEAASRLPALLAMEARIDSVPELTFDASTLLRFALYVTVGVGSWVGGALIERLLGAALDR